jgi:hypothetical protein
LVNSSGSGSGSGGTGSNLTSTVNPAMSVTVPSDFDLVQGTNLSKSVVVKNTGNKTLNNVTLSLSGVSWYTVSPPRVDQLLRNNEYNFTVTFSPPADATAASYQVTATASSAEISSSKTFNVKVNLSEANVQAQLIPDLNNYTSQLDSAESDTAKLESRGLNISAVKDLLASARSKLAEAKAFIDSKDYASAARLVDEAKSLVAQASAKMIEIEENSRFKIDPMWIVYGLVMIGIIAFVRYLLLPPKEEKKKTMYELLEEQENTIVEKIRRRLNNERKNKKK